MKGLVAGVFLGAALAFAGCGDSAEQTSAQLSDQRPHNCERPSPKVIASIEEGLTVSGGGSLGRAYAVRSSDFKKVWMVAAEIQGDGMKGTLGVWATNDIRSYGSVFAADHMAREFSDWGSGQVESDDDGIEAAKACLDS
jgi:hypothetical protein